MNTLVIGAGVLGLVTAWNLVEDGHDVTIVDRTGTYAGASHRSFAWINANHKLPESYYALNAAGIAAHRRLQDELSGDGVWFHQHGCIMIDSSADREVGYGQRLTEAQDFGYPVERIACDRLGELEPAVVWPAESALFFPDEGHLDNFAFGEMIEGFLARAGVRPEITEVSRITSDDSGVQVEFADSTVRSFDQVVLAAGADSRSIADRSGLLLPVASLDDPGPRTHSLLGVTAPTEVELNRVIISDRINVRPRRDGSLFVQIPPVEHRTEEGESEELLSEIRIVMETALDELFGTRIPVETVFFSGRSFPEDGLSIVGYLDEPKRVYALVTHSGMTLSALLGRLVANELGGGPAESLLADFRPSRFEDGINPVAPTGFIGRQ